MYQIPDEKRVQELCLLLLGRAGDTVAPKIYESTRHRFGLVPIEMESWVEQTGEANRKAIQRLKSEGKYDQLEYGIRQAGFHTLLHPDDGLMCGVKPDADGKGIQGIYITVWLRNDGCYITSFSQYFRLSAASSVLDVCLDQLNRMREAPTDVIAKEIAARHNLIELDDSSFLWYET